jgi:hypothetical protein
MCHNLSNLPRKFAEYNIVILTLPQQMELGFIRIIPQIWHLILCKYCSNILTLPWSIGLFTWLRKVKLPYQIHESVFAHSRDLTIRHICDRGLIKSNRTRITLPNNPAKYPHSICVDTILFSDDFCLVSNMILITGEKRKHSLETKIINPRSFRYKVHNISTLWHSSSLMNGFVKALYNPYVQLCTEQILNKFPLTVLWLHFVHEFSWFWVWAG